MRGDEAFEVDACSMDADIWTPPSKFSVASLQQRNLTNTVVRPSVRPSVGVSVRRNVGVKTLITRKRQSQSLPNLVAGTFKLFRTQCKKTAYQYHLFLGRKKITVYSE